MCKYCKEFKTGDCNDSILTGMLKINGVELIGIDVFITDDYLELFVDDAKYGSKLYKKKKKIKYCPMCGKKIEDGSD